MKVIDLLNKIAKGEDIPKKISYMGEVYLKTQFDDTQNFMIDYLSEENEKAFFDMYNISAIINEKVEIIEEEKKIPEKLEILNANEHSKEVYYEDYSKEEISLDIETLQNWVNKIIDYLKSKGE